LALRMTPGDGEVDQVVAPAASTAPSATATTGGSITTRPGVFSTADLAADGIAQALDRTLDSIVSFAGTNGDAEVTSFADAPAAARARVVVTPIRPAGYGLTTAAAVDGRAGPIAAILPSGDHVTAEARSSGGGIVVVLIAGAGGDDAAPLTDETDVAPGPFTVVADGGSFEVDDEELTSLSVPEAAPIFDADGNLVGLCTIGPDGTVEMVPLTSLPDIVLDPSTEPEVPIVSDGSAPTSEPDDTVTVSTPINGTDNTATSTADPTSPAGETSEPGAGSSTIDDTAVDSSAVDTDPASSVPGSSEPEPASPAER
jgi:hypothetical protein